MKWVNKAACWVLSEAAAIRVKWFVNVSLYCLIAVWMYLSSAVVSWMVICSRVDRYRAGTRYPILLAAAIPIPILGCTIFLYWIFNFVWGIGVYRLYMYAGYMRENTVYAWNYRCALQQCRLLRQVNKRQDYWYRHRYSNKYRPIPIPTNTGEYRLMPDSRYRYRSNPNL